MTKQSNLPRICNTSVDPHLGCDCTDCLFNIKHYDPQPDDWFITQKFYLEKQGQCLQSKGETGNG